MYMNLLTETLPEGYQKIPVSLSALYALIGFVLVFAGITLLILVVWAVGKIIHRNQAPMQTQQREVKAVQQEVAVADSNEINEETVAVIMAALTAYYQTNNPKCEFTVKRIKRI